MQDYELDGIPIEPCEQCNGTGYDKTGSRCACREEDDEAAQRRRNFKLMLGNTRGQE